MPDHFIAREMQLLSEESGFYDSESAMTQLDKLQSSSDREFPLPFELIAEAKLTIVFDIFLSYSSKDSLAVLGLFYWLTTRQYRVYVDCFDRALPNPAVVTRQTASILRKRMVQSQSLFVATTHSTPTSTWVPWELGFTDGLTNKAAVLYIAPQTSVAFNRQSYFALYPEVLQDATQFNPKDLILSDAVAVPKLNCDWRQWLAIPKQY